MSPIQSSAMAFTVFNMIDIFAYLFLHYPMRFFRNLSHPIIQQTIRIQQMVSQGKGTHSIKSKKVLDEAVACHIKLIKKRVNFNQPPKGD